MSNYSDMTADQMYTSSIGVYGSDINKRAYIWVECENALEVRAVWCEWFDALENGTANKRQPDPTNLNTPDGRRITQGRADIFIEELEADFYIENKRWRGLGKDAGPGFDRLEPHARIAFMQAIWRVMKTEEQIEEEAKERLENKDLPEKVINIKTTNTPSASPSNSYFPY